MKSMKSMERDDIMKMNGIMEKLYVGLDIHEKYITGTVMRKDGEIAIAFIRHRIISRRAHRAG